MAVPKKRTSKSRKRMRRSHDHLKYTASVTECENCGELKLRHHICPACGTYKNHQVFAVKSEAEPAETGNEDT